MSPRNTREFPGSPKSSAFSANSTFTNSCASSVSSVCSPNGSELPLTGLEKPAFDPVALLRRPGGLATVKSTRKAEKSEISDPFRDVPRRNSRLSSESPKPCATKSAKLAAFQSWYFQRRNGTEFAGTVENKSPVSPGTSATTPQFGSESGNTAPHTSTTPQKTITSTAPQTPTTPHTPNLNYCATRPISDASASASPRRSKQPATPRQPASPAFPTSPFYLPRETPPAAFVLSQQDILVAQQGVP